MNQYPTQLADIAPRLYREICRIVTYVTDSITWYDSAYCQMSWNCVHRYHQFLIVHLFPSSDCSHMELYPIMIFIVIVVTITWILMAINYLLIYILGFLYVSNSGSENAQLPGCFCPWTFSFKIWLNMFPLDSFMSCLYSLLGYSTGEFQALQLIVLAAFGAVDLLLVPYMLVHFLKI